MDNAKDDLYYIRKIQEDLIFIMRYMKDTDEESQSILISLGWLFTDSGIVSYMIMAMWIWVSYTIH